LKEDQASFSEVPDELWDGHGLLMAMLLMLSLAIISIVAMICLDYFAPKPPATTSAMLMIEQPMVPPAASRGQSK
jgi:hypothetical protein